MSRFRLRTAVPSVVALVTAGVLVGCGGSSTGATTGTDALSTPSTATSSAAASASASASVAPPSVGAAPSVDASGAVTFAGVTVGSATAVGTAPTITSTSATPAPGLLVQDLVVGGGAAASASSTVAVHYSGVLYADGTPFDSDFSSAQPTSFPLSGVVAGFGQGIGGTDGVEPMKAGGRRLLIFPAALGYGEQANGPIPAGASLVFVIDLVSVS